MFERIKDTIFRVVKSRMFVLVIAFCILFAVLINRVFYLQIVKGQYYLDNYKLQIRKTREIPGTRGNIYDRNGNLLAYNELAYSVTIEDNILGEDRNKRLNAILDQIISIVESNGDSVISSFGVVMDSAGNYEFTQTNTTQRLRFIADVYGLKTVDELSEKQRNSSAANIIEYLATDEVYGYGLNIKKLDKQYVLKMINLRYAINLNSYQKFIPTTLAMDVSDETAAEVMENLDKLEGVNIMEDSLRRYTNSKYFASIIGYTGKISQEEYDALDEDQKKKYSQTDVIGKSGLEQTVDEVLQGTKGKTEFYVDSVGKVTDTVSSKEPEAGNDVYLTIDKDLQEQTYQLIEEKLAGIVLSKLRNVMNYDPGATSDTMEIIIPVDDAYNAFIGNEIIDEAQFGAADAQKTEKQVYKIFTDRRTTAIQEIIDMMNNPNAPAYKDSTNEMKAYMDYISEDVLQTATAILMSDQIDTKDETYVQWTSEETINLNQYLNYAISKNWIDTSLLTEYVSEEKYSDSTEIYQGILSFLQDYLISDGNFDKLLYKYLIKSGGITGNQICAIVYEQGVLPMDEGSYNGLVDGSVDSFSWLYAKIQRLEITPGQLALEPCTGSAVVSDPNTGEVLACVSYPGYDNNRLANHMDSKYYNQLVTGLARPFYNNATQERTAPGSTYKMLSSVAGLTDGFVTGDSLLTCTGEFTPVTPSPKCWSYPYGSHGSINVVTALDVSCNCYYYDLGYQMGLDKDGNYDSDKGIDVLTKYAKEFGLDEKSGIEIPESEPQISDEYSVLTAIGQGNNNFTVSQLNRYVSAVANKGTVYKLTLLNKTTDAKGKIIKRYDPVVTNEIKNVSSTTWDLVQTGMVSMINSTASFSGIGIGMAGKTGTAQQSELHADHGLFVGYAPADKPTMAVSVRIANGYTSAYAAELGRDIVRANFKLAEKEDLITGTAAQLGSAISD